MGKLCRRVFDITISLVAIVLLSPILLIITLAIKLSGRGPVIFKQQRAGINRTLTFQEADTTELPFDDDHFQIVSVAFGLRNVSDTDRGIAEMVRVCQPGG